MSATMDHYAILRPLTQKPWLYAELGLAAHNVGSVAPKRFQRLIEKMEAAGHVTVVSGGDKPYGAHGSRTVSITDSGRAILENPSAPAAPSASVGGGSQPKPA